MDPKDLIEAFGTVGILAIVFAESGLLAGFFLPGDSLLFTAGLLASQGHLALLPLVVGCPVAAVAGDQVGYLFGRRVGPSLFGRPDARFFRQRNLDLARDYFARHGARTVVLARFVPIVRTFTPVVAGVADMPWRTFVVFNVFGGVGWGAGAVLAGWALGQVGGGHRWLYPVSALVFGLSFLPVIAELVRVRRGAGPQRQADGVVEAHGLEGDE
ncbi:MAG: DedA family protein [Acidimicrobiales bacterium]